MRIEKMLWEQMEITIEDITLLSSDEYEKYRVNISVINDWWWLLSPDFDSYFAAGVHVDGSVSPGGYFVRNDLGAVRPVVVLRLNPESQNLQIGDKFRMAGHVWTIICENMALCDSAVGYTPFREDWEADDVNQYDASDVKVWQHNWAVTNGIEIVPKEE